ncbi:MAG: hypothetical protein AB7U75_14780 [Hyphomicrobiaceae bacterium]
MFDPQGEPDEEGILFGFCLWDPDQLPHSMRYANRERTAVYSNDGEGCACFQSEGCVVSPAAMREMLERLHRAYERDPAELKDLGHHIGRLIYG